MAKVVSDEILKLKIIVNGDDAQKRVTDLEEANKKLSDSISSVKNEQKKLSIERKSEQQELRAVKLAIEDVTARINARSTASKQLDATLASLQRKEAELKQKTDQSTAAFAKNKNEIAELTSKIADNKSKIDAEIRSMDIMSLTSAQLNRRMNDLKFTMANMNPNTPAYKDAQADMQRLTGRMTELRTGASGSANSIGALADKFNRYQGIAVAATATLAGVSLSLQKVIDLNNKLADAQTTVSKTTGMNKEEVDELTKSFAEFNTRTARMDLLKISEIGGRLGVPKDEIKDFTKEVDKAFVALGDGFTGGVEAVANKLGKIKGLFKETKDLKIADAMNQVGSAMNELGAAGAASEENIAEFALRVGSLPDVLKPTIGDALALGAAFEESGIDAERSGTAYTNFISIAAKSTKAFSEVMRIPQQQVKDMINTNPTEFFLKFAEGLKGLDATELSSVLEHLKLNDQYVKSILGSASENTDRFRKSMELSNTSLKEATSLQIEFDKVNNNAAATYEKVRKKFLAMFTTESVAKSLNFVIEILGRLLGVTDETDKKTNVFKETIVFLARVFLILATSIISVSVVWAVYNNLIKDSIIRTTALEAIEKGRNLRIQISTMMQNLWNLSIGNGQKALARFVGFLGFQTTATNLQTAAQARLNLVTKANPYMAILSVITLLITAYFTYKSVMETTAKTQKTLNEALKEGVANAAQETSSLDKLYKTATNVKLSMEERLAAVKKLKAEFPSYFGQISDEIILNGKARASYLELREAIISSSRSKAAAAELERREGERLKRDEEWRQRMIEEQKRQKELIGRGDDETLIGDTYVDNSTLVAAGNQRIKTLIEERISYKRRDVQEDQIYIQAIDANNKKAEKLTKDREKIEGGKSSYKTDFGSKEVKAKKTQLEKDAENAQKEYENMRKKILESAENYDQKELERAAKLEDAKADIMQDGFIKEYMQIKAEEQRQIASLEKEKHSDQEYKNIDKIISREKGKLKEQFEAIRAEWKKNDADYSEMQLLETEKTKIKLASLNEKYVLKALKKQEDDLKKLLENYKDQTNVAIYENDTVEKQKVFLKGLGYSDDSLQKIKTWEEGRKEIEKHFQQKSLDDQVAFLRRKIAEFNVLMAMMPLSISPEQLEQIEKYKVQINELLAEITKLKNGESGDKKGDFTSLKSLGGSTDLLGLSSEQWSDLFKKTDDLQTNILKVAAAIQVAQAMFSQYSAFVQANEQAMLRRMEAASDRKQRKYKKELADGYINQATYKKLTLQNETDLEKKKAELSLKAAKRERAMNIASAISGTAIAVVGALGNKPWTPFNMVLAGLVGVMGAVQLATIMKQPLPEAHGAEEGFYPTIRQQDGKLFNARRKRSSTGIYNEPTMLVGEGGASMPELVVSGRDLKRINPTIQRQYMQEISRVRGFEDGLYPTTPTSSGNDEIMIEMMALLRTNIDVLNEIKLYGIKAYFEKNARNGKDIDEMRQEYLDLKNRNKH